MYWVIDLLTLQMSVDTDSKPTSLETLSLASKATNGSTISGVSPSQGGSRKVSVPQLDKESLSTNGTSNTAPLTVTGGNGNGGYTLVSPAEESTRLGLAASLSPSMGGVGVHLDPTALPYAILQHQQQQQAVAMAAAQLEQSFNQTSALLQQCSRSALLSVLMSLLADYPTTLVLPIQMRVEHILSQQMSPLSSGGARASTSARRGSTFVPNSSAAPWTPSGGVQGGSHAATPNASAGSPHANSSPSHRRWRGHRGKEEEQELCSIHNTMRATKHLQLNGSTGLYECIHGFHCLVDGQGDAPVKRPTPKPASPPSTAAAAATGAAGAATPTNNGKRSGGRNNNNKNAPNSVYNGASYGFPTPQVVPVFYCAVGTPQAAGSAETDHHSRTPMQSRPMEGTLSPPDDEINMDLPTLESLLKSVRDMGDESDEE